MMSEMGLGTHDSDWARIIRTTTAADPAARPTARELLRLFEGKQSKPRSRALQIGAVVAALSIISFAIFHERSYPVAKLKEVKPSIEIETTSRPVIKEEAKIPASKPFISNEANRQKVDAVLARWAQAIRDRDVDEQMLTYAREVDPYFGRRHVAAAELRANKARVFNSIGAIEQFTVRNVRYEQLISDRAVVSFDKAWRFGGRRPFWGSARERMRLRSFKGEWKIVSEVETKVYSSGKAAWNE